MPQETDKNIEIVSCRETDGETRVRTRDFHPSSFQDYCGQQELKKKLEIYARAAEQRHEPLDHTLFYGPPGLGKTTLAHILAKTLGVEMLATSGPAIERTGDLVALLSNLQERDLLFIDEIHRIPRIVEEILYNALEKCTVDIIVGQGAGAQAVTLPIKPFTLVGATTKTGLISAPLRSRFGIIERLDFYSPEELVGVVLKNTTYLKMDIDQEAALMIAKASRGTPRITKRLVRRIRDLSQVESAPCVTTEVVYRSFELLGIDSEGLTSGDRKLLHILISRYNGGPVGLDTLAALLSEDRQTIEDVYEPYLLRQGYLEKTSRGRQVPTHAVPVLIKKLSIERLLGRVQS